MRGSGTWTATAALVAVERVRCLDCGWAYSKPMGGGTAAANPGCPECGYVGWLPATIPGAPTAPSRSGEDLPLRRSVRSR